VSFTCLVSFSFFFLALLPLANHCKDDELLRKFELWDRTRLIGPDWQCAQCWTNLIVPRQVRFHDTKFSFTMDKDDTVVISLSQLDDRYIRGLEGDYKFTLQFRLEKDGEGEILARSSTSFCTSRSVNAEIDLTQGTYSLYIKIRSSKNPARNDIRIAAKKFLKEDTSKLIQIAKKYNFAHMKKGVGDKEDRIFEDLNGEQQQPAAQVSKAPASCNERPESASMDHLPYPREEPIPATDQPVENPVTLAPEAISTEKSDPSAENWKAIATIGLRLFTRQAAVRLSVISGSTKDANQGENALPNVIITGESGPIGNVPPIGDQPVAPPTVSSSSTVVDNEGSPTAEKKAEDSKSEAKPTGQEDNADESKPVEKNVEIKSDAQPDTSDEKKTEEDDSLKQNDHDLNPDEDATNKRDEAKDDTLKPDDKEEEEKDTTPAPPKTKAFRFS
jgi:hypothetical protein